MGKKKLKSPPHKKGSRIGGPADAIAINYNREPPIFSFRHACKGWQIADCSTEQKASLADTIHLLSSINWQDIYNAPRQGHGSETLSQEVIDATIPTIVTPDTTLIGVRFHNRSRMVGFREGAIFHIVWLDHNMRLYDHGN